MRWASSAFRRTRTVVSTSIFVFQAAVTVGTIPPGAGFLSLSFRFRTRRWQRRRYTTRTSDRRIVWRVLAKEFRYSCVKRAASSHFLPRSTEEFSQLPPPLLFWESSVVRRNEMILVTNDVAWWPLVALGFGQRPPRCFTMHAAEGRPSVLAVARASQGSPRTTLVRVEDGRRDGSSRTIGI